MEHVFRRFTAGKWNFGKVVHFSCWKTFTFRSLHEDSPDPGMAISGAPYWILRRKGNEEFLSNGKYSSHDESFHRWSHLQWWLKNALQDSHYVGCQFVLGNWFPCLAKFGTLLLRHFIPFEKLVRFRKTSDNLRLQNILTSSSLAVEIQNASSEISRTFRHGLSPRLEKLATAWAQLLSSALSCHHLKFRGSLFARPVHFHRVSVTIPLLTLPMIHGLLLELRHLTAKTSFLG